jgi:hypothetical protein
MGVPPQIIHFNGIFHYKPSIWGYLHLWKPPFIVYFSPNCAPLAATQDASWKDEHIEVSLSACRIDFEIFRHVHSKASRKTRFVWGHAGLAKIGAMWNLVYMFPIILLVQIVVSVMQDMWYVSFMRCTIHCWANHRACPGRWAAVSAFKRTPSCNMMQVHWHLHFAIRDLFFWICTIFSGWLASARTLARNCRISLHHTWEGEHER